MLYSAGIIPYRKTPKGKVEFFVGHPGVTSWENKPYWAFLKGCVEGDEEWPHCAVREFCEESGISPDVFKDKELQALGSVRQNRQKVVIAYAVEFPDIDPQKCFSNMADNGLNYEIDGYKWMEYDDLRKYTHPTHMCFYDEIMNRISDEELEY